MEITHKESVAAVAKANSEFTKKLYGELIKTATEGQNVILSPFSISAVVSMVLAGAKGKTAEQIRTGLSLPADEHLLTGYQEALATLVSNENFTLDTANKLYVQDGFKLLDSFLETTLTNYHAESVSTNFADGEASRALINDFVEKQTNGKIKDLIKSGVLTALTRLVLVNAIYFKGDWARKFDPKNTQKGTFHLSDGSKVETDMMYLSSEFKSLHLADLDAQALEMPYKGDRLSMIFILPQNGLAKTEAALANYDFSGLTFGRATKHEVHIPKFKIESTHELNDPLKNLGLTDMFDESAADFSGMSDKEELYVSKVVQKAFIEVNEEGSEAAAATGIIMMTRMMVLTPQFRCDKPFLYLIKDNLTGLVLFAGRLSDPSKN